MILLLTLVAASIVLNLWAWYQRRHPPETPDAQYHKQTEALRKATNRVLP